MIRYDLRTLFASATRRVCFGVGLLALVPALAHAQLADPAFDRFRSQVVGNKVNFSYGSGGTPLGGAGNATGIGVSSGVDVGRPVAINTKHGPINGSLTQKISSNAMGKAFGRAAAFIGGPVGLAFLALPAIVDWMSDAGVSHDGTAFRGADPSAIPSSGTYWRTQSGPQYYGWSEAEVCRNWAAGQGVSGAAPVPSENRCQGTLDGWPSGVTIGPTTAPFPCPAGQYPGPSSCSPTPPSVELSGAELETRMGSVTNPSPEALAELYKLAAPQNLSHPVPDLVDTLRAEFESRSPETTETSTTDTPSETKTEEKTCATYTQLLGSTVTLVEECETTTTTQAKDPETGLPIGAPTTSTTTSSSNSPDPATKEEEQQEDACLKNPKRAGCAELDSPTEEVPSTERVITFAPEALGLGGGSCPAPYGWSDTLGSHEIDLAPYCDMTETIVRPLVLLFALLGAFFIVAPVWSNPS